MRNAKTRILASFLAAAGLAQAVSPVSVRADASGSGAVETRKFVVTAYYSPLPDQNYYLRGSYEADVRLNGNGTHGASGKPVYAGMLAAPKSYGFGTAIHLEGLGTGTVDDRGGAIVEAGERDQEFDRIDVWMGYGEEGLRRALAWGRRTVVGHVVPKAPGSKPLSSTIDIASVSKAPVSALAPKAPEERVWTEPVGPKSSPELVRSLSLKLAAAGYLDAPRNLFDAEVRFALIRLQNDFSLISGPSDPNAGYYGPSTRKALRKAYDEAVAERREVDAELDAYVAELDGKIGRFAKDVERIRASFADVRTVKDGEIGPHVRTLQEALSRLGYLNAKPTAIFGPKTREAVAQFQIEHGLVLTKADPNAGKFGAVTRSKLVAALVKSVSGPAK